MNADYLGTLTDFAALYVLFEAILKRANPCWRSAIQEELVVEPPGFGLFVT